MVSAFLFFAEVMAHLLRARTIGLQGVCLPIRDDSELLDSEYVNDTPLYMQHDMETLERVKLSLEVFYLVTGSKINWHKSIVSSLTQVLALNGESLSDSRGSRKAK